jgi:hypothetical protein
MFGSLFQGRNSNVVLRRNTLQSSSLSCLPSLVDAHVGVERPRPNLRDIDALCGSQVRESEICITSKPLVRAVLFPLLGNLHMT